jgi:hypothetical protein
VLAPTSQNQTSARSRNWQTVSKSIHKLAAGMYAVKSEGMFPYETHYVLATDEEVERLYERGTAMDEQLCKRSASSSAPWVSGRPLPRAEGQG